MKSLWILGFCAAFSVAACGDDGSTVDSGAADGSLDAPEVDTPLVDAPRTDTASDAPLGDVPTADALADSGPIEPVNPFDGIGEVERVSDQEFRFLEGPHWRPEEGVLLFTDLDFADGLNSVIYQLTPPSTITEFRSPSLGANGLATDIGGNLLAAEQYNRRVSITRGDSVDTFVDRFEGNRFSSPNDITVRRDGTVYFTDPPYGLGGDVVREISFNGLYRVAPDGEITAEYEGDAEPTRPNGVVLSPDERTLYLAETGLGNVLQFDVAEDGSLSGERQFTDGTPLADGMAVDSTGNIYVSTREGVKVYNPTDGSLWGTIEVPLISANCGFGDPDMRTLYITARQGLFRVRLALQGL